MNGEKCEEIFDYFCSADSGYLLEELIIQENTMARFNPSSINTIRFCTFLNETGYMAAYPHMRAGLVGMVVDNAGAGGISASIDVISGSVITDGFEKNGKKHSLHPDSKMKFKGFQIPRWSELLQIAEECHRLIPEYHYIGWDFALTDEGWVLVEANWGQFMVQQITLERPLKKEWMDLLLGDHSKK